MQRGHPGDDAAELDDTNLINLMADSFPPGLHLEPTVSLHLFFFYDLILFFLPDEENLTRLTARLAPEPAKVEPTGAGGRRGGRLSSVGTV